MKKRDQKAVFWREHVARFKLSGASLAKYCRDNNLKPSVFRYWVEKLGSATAPSFLPVQIKSSPGIAGSSTGSVSTKLLCALEVRGGVVKIYDSLVLSFVLDRVL